MYFFKAKRILIFFDYFRFFVPGQLPGHRELYVSALLHGPKRHH